MKIIHLVDYFHPMMGYQENHLCVLQREQGHDVTVISGARFTPWGDRDSAYFRDAVQKGDAELAAKGIKVLRLDVVFEYSHRVWLKDLKQTIYSERADLVHVHGYATINAFLAALYKPLNSYKLIIDDHMLFAGASNPFAPFFYPVFKMTISKLIQKKADRIVAVSDETVDFMSRAYGISKQRIEVIYLGVNRQIFNRSEEKRREYREKFNLGQDEFIMIYTGKMDTEKNPLFALKAALSLWKKGVKFKFFLVGSGRTEYLSLMEDFVISSGVRENVIFQPMVSNEILASYFNMADLAIWPCQSSMSVLEAMACGCPVILSNSRVNSQRLECGSGEMFKPGDMAELGSRMEKIINDPVLRAEMGQKGVDFTSTLDWKTINDKFAGVMKED